jgi:RNA polymerase sigma factor for flagellar operon FliA
MNQALQNYRNHETRLQPREDRERQVREYLPLVHRIALRLKRNLPPSVELEDLISAGCVGLLSAIERYQAERGLDFATFAEFRIKGAMLDELRGLDPLTRGERRLYRQAEKARCKLQAQLGREPADEEVARELNLEVDDWRRRSAEIQPAMEMSMLLMELRERYAEQSAQQLPDRRLQQQRLKEKLLAAVRELPERLRNIISLYYFGHLNYREIASLLQITESRVCQLHQKAVRYIRQLLLNGRPLALEDE